MITQKEKVKVETLLNTEDLLRGDTFKDSDDDLFLVTENNQCVALLSCVCDSGALLELREVRLPIFRVSVVLEVTSTK